MTSTTAESQVFKVDRRGRVHVPKERREALLEEFARSGASAPEFARLVGIKYATFAGWRAKRAQALTAGEPADGRVEVAAPRAAVRLLEAVVEAPAAAVAGGLVIELPGAARLLVSAVGQVPWAAELLRLLGPSGGRPC